MKEPPKRVVIHAAGNGRVECLPGVQLVDLYRSNTPLDTEAVEDEPRRPQPRPGLSADRKSYQLGDRKFTRQ